MFYWFLSWDELSHAEARLPRPKSLFIPRALTLASPAGANNFNTSKADAVPFPLFY